MNIKTLSKLTTNESVKPDKVASTVKIIFGVFLLVRIVKTSADLYFTIEDRKNKGLKQCFQKRITLK